MFKRLVHFLLIALAVLIIVALIAAVIVQVILWTDLPGNWVLSALSQRTGMDISAERFRTSWRGTTEISGLTARFPLEDTPFAEAEEMALEHSSLLSLALGAPFKLDEVSTVGALLRVIEDVNGRWNVQGLTQLGGDKQQEDRPVHFPDVQAKDVSIYIRDRRGREMLIDPVRIEAARKDLQWTFQAGAPPSLAVKGRIGTSRPFTHEIKISLDNLDAFSSAMIPDWLEQPQIEAQWDGYLSGDQLAGRLSIQQAKLKQNRFSGTVNIEANSEAVSVRIRELDVQPAGLEDFTPEIAGSRLRYDLAGKEASLRDLTVKAGPVVLNGSARWDVQSQEIAAEGRWITAASQDSFQSEGRWSATAQMAEPGLKNAALNLEGQYRDGDKRLDAHVAVSGSGTEWTESHWTIRFPSLLWQSDKANIDPGSGQAAIRVNWPTVELQQASFADIRSLQATGYYTADSRKWSLDVDADGIPAESNLRQDSTIDLTIRAEGDARSAVLSQASVRWGDFQANAKAAVQVPGGTIQEGTLTMSGRLRQYPDGDFLSRFSRNPWRLQTTVQGSVHPLNVSLDGRLQVEVPRTKIISENVLHIPFKLEADGAELRLRTASYITENVSWMFHGNYHLSDQNGRLYIDLNKLPLSLISEMFGGWNYEGRLSGKLTADFPRPELSALDLQGSWTIKDFGAESFAAEQVTGDIHMKSGLAELENILAQCGQGRLSGRGRINLNASRQASFEFSATDWVYPAQLSPVSMTADAELTVDVDLRANRVVGQGTMVSDIYVLSQDAGTVELTASLDDRVLSVSDISGRLLGGDLSGTARVPLENWMDSRADMQFQNIQLDRLPDWQEDLQGIGGLLSGQVVIKETAEANPLEPLSISVHTQMRNGRFNEAQIGNFRLTAYAGPTRVLVTEAVLQLFSGIIQAQARWTMHDRAYMHLNASFSNINVNQILKAANPQANPVEGTLDGSATLLSTSNLKGLSGRIEGRLSNSNLINNTVIGSIYRSLVLGAQPSKPQGRGTIELHPRGARLEIDSFYYFNEGIEVRGSGVIEDIERGMESPVSGLVFGTTRPLGNINLPGVAELDDLMGVLLLGSAAVEVDGTLGDVETKVVPVPEVTDAIRSLIWSQRQQGQ